MAVAIGAHGIAGAVRLKVFATDLARYRSFNDGSLSLLSLKEGDKAVATFAEVADRTAAEAMRGVELTVPRRELPVLADGEYYHADLIGLVVQTATGDTIGRIVAVDDFGAGDVIEIERPNGKRFMVPMRVEAVPEWNDERLIVAADFIE